MVASATGPDKLLRIIDDDRRIANFFICGRTTRNLIVRIGGSVVRMLVIDRHRIIGHPVDPLPGVGVAAQGVSRHLGGAVEEVAAVLGTGAVTILVAGRCREDNRSSFRTVLLVHVRLLHASRGKEDKATQ